MKVLCCRSFCGQFREGGCEVGETPNQVSSDKKQSVGPSFLCGDNFGWSRFVCFHLLI